jgi:hypothetical protein
MPAIKANNRLGISSIDISVISRDPLLELIISYRQGLSDFAANAPDERDASNEFAENSYRPHRRALESWTGGARTFAGALSALRMARDADRNDDAEIVSAMVCAALGYFETVI